MKVFASAVFVATAAASGLLAQVQSPQSAVVVDSAPATIVPDSTRTPLTVLKEGTVVRIVKIEGDWYQVSFKDAQWGDRTAYVRGDKLRVNTVAENGAPPAPVAHTSNPAPAAATPAAPQSSPMSGTTEVKEPVPATRRPARGDGRIGVFVRGAQGNSGFTDPSKDRADSVKDLRNHILDSKVLFLSESPDGAAVVLDVLARETRREVNGWTAVSGGAQNKSYVTVRVRAGEFETELTGESGSKGMLKGYGAAAGKVIDQLEKWARENRDRLLALQR